MAKLILSLENKLLGEYRLDKERTSIGRRPANDIYIDNLAVSGEHAAILKVGNDYYVQDLDSTNGTYVNSKAIKQYHLKNADVIDFGKYKLEYINEQVSAPSAQSEIKASLEKISELMKRTKAAFEEAALKTKYKPRLTEPFAKNGYIKGLGPADELGKAAFDTKTGEISPAIRTRVGFCILSVIEIIPIDVKKFKKEKEEFTKKSFEAKRSKILNDWFYQLIESANLKSNIPPDLK